jgi:hypothetical protein
MSTAHSAVPAVFAPLHGLWRWLMPIATRESSAPTKASVCVKELAHPVTSKMGSASARRPLRVVRILEADQAPAQVGRMLISGRMADVCAELDRLAAREAALH